MAQVKIKEGVASLYKTSVVLVISGIITFLLSNTYFTFLPGIYYASNLGTFFSNTSLPVLYGTLIGLLLSSFAIVIAVVPIFSTASLRQPIFNQINRLYTFTILDGILLLIINFTNGIINYKEVLGFIYIEIFFFVALMIGLVFCVLSLSDLFKIIRRSGSRENITQSKKESKPK